MQKIITVGLALLFPFLAFAESPDSLLGTFETEFTPLQAHGKREGCTLGFKAAAQDFVYKQGEPVLVGGGITVYGATDNIIISLKLGIIDNVASPGSKVTEPEYAYLQTKNGNTSDSFVSAASSDLPGFKVFIYRFDKDTPKVLADLYVDKTVTIGFNRKKGATDILVPIDLTVAESTLVEGAFKRRHSDAMLDNFAFCTREIIDRVAAELEKKNPK